MDKVFHVLLWQQWGFEMAEFYILEFYIGLYGDFYHYLYVWSVEK